MKTIRHAALWIDRHEAKVFHVTAEGFDVSKLVAQHHVVTRKADERGQHVGHERFFQDVAVALKDAEQVLVVGPSSAKLDFIRYAHDHDRELAKAIVGVETLDHPTNGQLAAYVRHYFHDKDRMDGLVR
jgi:stalled ribosome rescue protein Dom34